MKIGIISINMYSKGLNFACPLHTYAFQQFLQKNGFDSTVIDYVPVYYDNFDLKHPYDYYKKYCEKAAAAKPDTEKKRAELEARLQRYQAKADAWEPLQREREMRYKKIQNFIARRYRKTKHRYNSDLLEVEDPGFDCYICATDVIWKNQPDFGFDRGFFLGSTCMEQKWKIAYSASRGAYEARDEAEKKLFFHYLSDFDAVSVREASLKRYLEQNSSMEVTHVLDPVLLHDADFYDQIAVRPPEEHYLLLYYVMEQADDTVRHAVTYARRHNMKIIEITDNPLKGGKLAEYPDADYTFRFDIGIEEWIGYIKYADCIFTNSFHGCCLSILYKKDFYVGFRKSSDKIIDLLKTFRLTGRFLSPIWNKRSDSWTISQIQNRLSKYIPADLDKPPIDYGPVFEILKQQRQVSSDFLLAALRNAEQNTRPHKDYDTFKKALTYPILYNSRLKDKPFTSVYDESAGTLSHLPSGSFEYSPKNSVMTNDGASRLQKNGFRLKGYQFRGWNIRICIDNQWFWYLADGTLKSKKKYKAGSDQPYFLFVDGDVVPYIPVNRISKMVAEAVWERCVPNPLNIGLISINMYSKTLNFACPLHTLAFQQFLLKNEIKSTIIDYKPVYYDNYNLKYPYNYYFGIFQRLAKKKRREHGLNETDTDLLKKMKRRVRSWKLLHREREIRYDKFQNFIEKNYVKTDICYDSDLLEVTDPGFNCYICVTDVIWKDEPPFGFDRGFFLGSSCMEQKWKIAYSPSWGVKSDYDREKSDLFFHYMSDIDALSVREYSMKQFLEKNSPPELQLSPVHVLDPVLLHDSDFYDHYAVTPPEKHYVLLYYVMEHAVDTIEAAVNYARRHNLLIIETTEAPLTLKHGKLSKYPDVNYIFRYDIGVEEWIGYIKHAKAVFTNSFHACCLALLYEKNLYIGYRNSGKVAELVRAFGLQGRYLPKLAKQAGSTSGSANQENSGQPAAAGSAELSRKASAAQELELQKEAAIQAAMSELPETPIDYAAVRTTLLKRREKSARFILSAISRAEQGPKPARDYENYKKTLRYPIIYNSLFKKLSITYTYDASAGTIKVTDAGATEYRPNEKMTNNGTSRFLKNGFQIEGMAFLGWYIRFRIDNRWFWYLEDGSAKEKSSYEKRPWPPCRLFEDEAAIPYIPVNRISLMVAEAVWKSI